MKMKVDLSKFKLKSRDKHTATLVHPEGHEFKVAIRALQPENRKNLEALEKLPSVEAPKMMAEGGEAEDSVQNDSQQPPITLNINTSNPQIPAAMINPNVQPAQQMSAQQPQEPPKEEVEPKQDEKPAKEANQGLAASTPPAAVTPATPESTQGLDTVIKGINQVQQATVEQAARNEIALKANMASQQGINDQITAKTKEIDDEMKHWIQDQKDFKIDPNHYYGSMSTGGKIATAIGLLLGGIGGGLTHGPNQALEFLNKQIDRDIDTQKAEMGKRHTLFSANLQRLGNERDAIAMTRMMMQQDLANQLEVSALKSNSLKAQGIANQQIGPLMQQIEMQKYQMALRNVASGGGQPGGNQTDPALLIPALVPKEHQKEAFHEVQQGQNAQKLHGTLMNLYDKATQEQTAAGSLGRAGSTAPAILALRAMMLPLIHDKEGRVNEFEQKTLSDLEPAILDIKSSRLKEKRDAFEKFLTDKESAPVAKGFGIDLSKFQSTATGPEANLNAQQKSFLDWARKNPADPRAKAVIKKLGISE